MMRGSLKALLVIAVAVLVWSAAPCVGQVVGCYYFPDMPFPQYMDLWTEGWSFTDANGDRLILAKPGMPLGGYLFVHFKNDSDKPIKVTDLALQGVKLSEGLAKTEDTAGPLDGHSVLVSKLPKEQIGKLLDAGQPVWWKSEPRTVAPGAMSQIVMRLRRDPKPEKLDVTIITDAKPVSAVVPTRKPQPRFATIAFTPELDRVYLYARHPKPGMKPVKMLMDEQDVTAQCIVGADTSLDLAPIVLSLSKPLDMMSYHCFRAIYSDGSAAASGIHAWGWEFAYGMWGGLSDARQTFTDFARHNINVQMSHANKAITEFSFEQGGKELLDSLGIRQMATWFGNCKKPLFYFLQDEPDAQDPGIDDLQPADRLGCVGQYLVKKMEDLQFKDAKTPILLNIDNTYKPENWYVYHQLADIPCHDPYYPGELDSAYTNFPATFGVHTRPTYVLATAAISESACQPKPLHTILCTTKYVPTNAKPGDYVGRFPTPAEKRLEVYYAISMGTKGISYWWFTAGADCYGLGADDPEAKALWKEIGLLGAEVRTGGSVITTSCPLDLPWSASRFLTVRCLARGQDTVAVIVVNDNVLCDRVGTVVKACEKAKAFVQMPSWLSAKDAFEITSDGIKDVTWKPDGGKIAFDLGTLDLSRFIIVTANPELRGQLEKLYKSKFEGNVKALTGGK